MALKIRFSNYHNPHTPNLVEDHNFDPLCVGPFSLENCPIQLTCWQGGLLYSGVLLQGRVIFFSEVY